MHIQHAERHCQGGTHPSDTWQLCVFLCGLNCDHALRLRLCDQCGSTTRHDQFLRLDDLPGAGDCVQEGFKVLEGVGSLGTQQGTVRQGWAGFQLQGVGAGVDTALWLDPSPQFWGSIDPPQKIENSTSQELAIK